MAEPVAKWLHREDIVLAGGYILALIQDLDSTFLIRVLRRTPPHNTYLTPKHVIDRRELEGLAEDAPQQWNSGATGVLTRAERLLVTMDGECVGWAGAIALRNAIRCLLADADGIDVSDETRLRRL